jgi:hypothetical protein
MLSGYARSAKEVKRKHTRSSKDGKKKTSVYDPKERVLRNAGNGAVLPPSQLSHHSVASRTVTFSTPKESQVSQLTDHNSYFEHGSRLSGSQNSTVNLQQMVTLGQPSFSSSQGKFC